MLGNPGEHSFLRELAKRDWAVTAPSLPGFTGSSEATELRNLHDWVVSVNTRSRIHYQFRDGGFRHAFAHFGQENVNDGHER